LSVQQKRIDYFDLRRGRVLTGGYRVERKLGSGWEGEVYEVIEQRTGIRRAAKLFYPQRNPRDRAARFQAKKLERLRHCGMVIQYSHTQSIRVRGQEVTCLFSELAGGELLAELVARQPFKRMHPYEALHLIYAIACGLEEIHDAGEYHGDLHDLNVLVTRNGIFFEVKLLDFYPRGRKSAALVRDDVLGMVRLLYDAIGGRRYYALQPPEIKAVCLGLRSDLIVRAFPDAHALRSHLETFVWER
jgi:serine/threonine protein kinase